MLRRVRVLPGAADFQLSITKVEEQLSAESREVGPTNNPAASDRERLVQIIKEAMELVTPEKMRMAWHEITTDDWTPRDHEVKASSPTATLIDIDEVLIPRARQLTRLKPSDKSWTGLCRLALYRF